MSVSLPSNHDCNAFPRLQDGSCAACRTTHRPMGVPFVPVVASAKTEGVAVMMSLLWFGAGHLYANRMGTGIVLAVLDALLFCIALTGVGLIVAVPVWLVAAPSLAVLSTQAVTTYNNGLTSC